MVWDSSDPLSIRLTNFSRTFDKDWQFVTIASPSIDPCQSVSDSFRFCIFLAWVGGTLNTNKLASMFGKKYLLTFQQKSRSCGCRKLVSWRKGILRKEKLLKNEKFERCLYSSLKINCLIFFWKESEVWQAAMSLVKSWELRKLTSERKLRGKSEKSTFN